MHYTQVGSGSSTSRFEIRSRTPQSTEVLWSFLYFYSDLIGSEEAEEEGF